VWNQQPSPQRSRLEGGATDRQLWPSQSQWGALRKISRIAMTVSKERSINGLPQRDIEKISCFTTLLASASPAQQALFLTDVLGNGDRCEYQPLRTAASKRTPPATKRKLPVQSCRARILGIWLDPPRRRRRKTGTNDVRADQHCPATAKPMRMIFSSVR
jgi:hypothetical protein